MYLIPIGFQVLTLLVVLYVVRKIAWIQKSTEAITGTLKTESANITRQIEELDGLYRRVGLQRGDLPPTRGWAASPDFLNILHDYITDKRPEYVVECGSGLTSIVAGEALQQIGRGKLLSLDHDSGFGEQTRGHLQRLGLTEFVEVKISPLQEFQFGGETFNWYGVADEELPERIDLIVIDGPPVAMAGEEGRYAAGPRLFPRLSSTGAVLLDDCARPGERAVLKRFLAELPGASVVEHHAEKGCVLIALG